MWLHLVTIGWLWCHFNPHTFPLLSHHQMAMIVLVAIRCPWQFLVTNCLDVAIVKCTCDCSMATKNCHDCLLVIESRLSPWNYMRLKNIVSFLCYLLSPLDLVSLVVHSQSLCRTSNDLNKLKPWICGGFCWFFCEKLENLKPWPFET
jgi:hypothetical protein